MKFVIEILHGAMTYGDMYSFSFKNVLTLEYLYKSTLKFVTEIRLGTPEGDMILHIILQIVL